MAGKGKPPVARIKAKRTDGTELQTTDRSGAKVRQARIEIAVVWENDGRKTLKYTDPRVQAAVEQALGGPCYFDVYDNDGGPAKSRQVSASGDSDSDDDF
jgi:hypothetical protein